jgi:hypothetical protein
MRYLSFIAVLLLAACARGGAPAGAATPTLSAGPASPSAVSAPAPHAYREVTALGDFALLSPDGRIVWSFVQGPKGTTPYFVFQRLDGTVVGRFDNQTAMGRAEWLRDSSGVFVELAAGQRAGPLGVVGTDGTLIETGLDDASPALSPDGKWIAAERQEGCCVGIRIHEIKISPRAGGAARSLVVSTDPAPQPVSLLGWNPAGEVIYRDGGHIRSVTGDGRITELPASAATRARMTTRSAVSPDGRVILTCAADPLAFWVITAGAVVDLGLRPAWQLREPWCSRPDEVIWLGAHDLPVRDGPGGSLLALDPTTGTTRPLDLPAGSTLAGASGDALLVSVGGELKIVSASTGLIRAVGLRIAGDSVVRPIDGGRFYLVTGRSGYLIG